MRIAATKSPAAASGSAIRSSWTTTSTAPADFIFNIHAARTPQQRVLTESFVVDAAGRRSRRRSSRIRQSPRAPARRAAARSASATRATVEVDALHGRAGALVGDAARRAAGGNRCRSCGRAATARPTRCSAIAWQEFGHLTPGYAQVDAVCDWVRDRTRFQPGTSEPSHVGARNAGARRGRMPRFRASDDRDPARAQLSGADRHRRRLRRRPVARPAGFPCVRRGVHRRSLVPVRSDGHLAADRPDPDRHGPRRRGRLVRDDVRRRARVACRASRSRPTDDPAAGISLPEPTTLAVSTAIA